MERVTPEKLRECAVLMAERYGQDCGEVVVMRHAALEIERLQRLVTIPNEIAVSGGAMAYKNCTCLYCQESYKRLYGIERTTPDGQD